MTTYNGTLNTETRSITHSGDATWSTAPDWGSYTSWVLYTSGPYLGATGTPLRYQTDIIDLGEIRDCYFEVNYSADGTVWTTVEHSEADSGLSSPTFIEKYTTDNTASGTVETHTVLDHYEEGYCDQVYTGFRARYVRFTAYVENWSSAAARGIPVLGQFTWTIRTDTISEHIQDQAVSGDAHSLSFSRIGTVINMVITPHDAANQKLTPHIVSKTAQTIRVLDANSFSVSGVSATVDVRAEGIPGSFEVSKTGIFKEAQ